MLIINIFLNAQAIFAQCHIDDRTALKALYESTGGDNNWSSSTSISWQEVTGSTPSGNCNLNELIGVDLDDEGRVCVVKFICY